MLGYFRNVQLSFLVIALTCYVSMAYAGGDYGNDEACSYNTTVCPSTPDKKYKRHRKECTQKSRHYHRHVEKPGVLKSNEIESESAESLRAPKNSGCNDSIVGRYCEPLPPIRVNCKTINPSDLVDFTCDGFSDKAQSCEPYSCQAPYVLDPTVQTTWQIHGKTGNRCLISNTTEDIGIKDDNEMPVPLTQMCEYDDIGIKGLIQRFSDVEKRYFHFSTCEHFEGVYNCTFKSGGTPIK